MQEINYTSICFIIMPFGIKTVGKTKINFDKIYKEIFEPAISEVELPEGGKLIPKRADSDFFSAIIDVEMFRYIEYSRFTVADITGLNPNVFYEIGVRHRAHQSGTAIFRQTDTPVPFDINHIKAFPYNYKPTAQAEESRQLIQKVLSESLLYNRLDSPVQLALSNQRQHAQTDNILRDAENAIRNRDFLGAIKSYSKAIEVDSYNPTLHLEKSLLLKEIANNKGDWERILFHCNQAIKISPTYSEAYRELGIAQNKLYANGDFPFDGEEALLKAISLDNGDFDAYSSLGGIYKRQERFEESLLMYQSASDISNGHPYPLLNLIKLRVKRDNSLHIAAKENFYLKRAEKVLRVHVSSNPPYNCPWCFFDLAEVCFYIGKEDEFLIYLEEGLQHVNAKWQIDTFTTSLLIIASGLNNETLNIGIKKLQEALNYF